MQLNFGIILFLDFIKFFNIFFAQSMLLKSRIVLEGLSDDMWNEENDSKLSTFVSDSKQQVLVVYIDEQCGLTVCSSLPPHNVQQLAYFVRAEGAVVTSDNFPDVVQFGSIHGSHVDGLLRALHGLYAPTFFEDTTWPDSILTLYVILMKLFCSREDTYVELSCRREAETNLRTSFGFRRVREQVILKARREVGGSRTTPEINPVFNNN